MRCHYQRREALRKLIVSSHSGSPALKILAAENIPSLFNDFLELEEEAINAIYDLCEDQYPQVAYIFYVPKLLTTF